MVRRRVAIIFRVNLDAIELSHSAHRPHTEPALRIPNYKECVAEKGHEACANLLPSRAASSEKCLHRVDSVRVDGATPRRFFQWLYEHGIDVAA